MKSALFLDPRFKSQLNHAEREIAVETLHKLYVQIKSRPSPSPNPSLNNIDRQIESQMFTTVRDQQSEAHLRAELTMTMSNYNAAQVTDINRDAIQFWRENKHIYPQLYELSNVVLSISSSISETERTFSGFAYIYNSRRMNLLPKNVTNILMIRLNRDLFYELKETKINEIKSQ